MEINRHSNNPVTGTSGKTVKETAATAAPAAVAATESNKPKPEPRLEQLQQAIRELPEVDMAQVEAIKKAMVRGELSMDVKALAHSILAYHRGGGQ